MFRIAMSLVSGLVHYYVYRRTVEVFEPGRRVRRILAAVTILFFLSVPVQTSARMWAPGLSATLGWISGPWLAFVGVSATLFAIVDLVRGGAWLLGKARPQAAMDPSRRAFLTRLGGGAALAVTG
ncbi:MAG: hypothetical protein ABI678_26135, partial [Kofleriaceae bacterium]